MHYVNEDYPRSVDIKPDYTKLIEQGYKKAKLRAHSDYMWNTINEWADRKDFDIMVEAKMKNYLVSHLRNKQLLFDKYYK